MKLLQFKAVWCSPCKQQTKEFEENPVSIELRAIDIDDEDNDLDLVTKYNVRSIPTMLLMDDNDEVMHRWTGFTKSSTINDFIRGFNTSKTTEENK